MTYLYNTLKRKGKAHVWTGDDTECLMWSTGGVKQDRKGWKLSSELGDREICHMCRQNSDSLEITRIDIRN